jgi:hypothetical protein
MFGGGFFGYAFPIRGTAVAVRLVIAAGGLVVGFIVSGVAVFLLVSSIVIPRLDRGSFWDHEVDCYMLHMIGEEWDDAGKGSLP